MAEAPSRPASGCRRVSRSNSRAAIESTEPQTLQDPSFNMEVELYEGEATFTLPVRIASGTSGGPQNLVANASYQSCNNKICLPPKTIKVEIPISVGK